MDKTKIRVIAFLFFVLVLNVALFGVLYAEEGKRLSKREASLRDLISELQGSDEARKAYYESITKQKEDLRRQMADSERNYDDLLKSQPDLVAAQKKQVTKVTQQVVPVTTKQTVSVSKPTSTKSTKTS